MDSTNISVILDTEFFKAYANEKHEKHKLAHDIYWDVIKQMMSTGEPGFSVNVGDDDGEDLRNACTEITSRDDSDICNLGSINMARVDSIEEFERLVEIAIAFLMAGTVYSDVPYPKVDRVRSKNRRLGLGLMGLHEWLLKNGKKYGPDADLEKYLEVYRDASDKAARMWSNDWDLSRPVKVRAIAPTGTIGIVAETTTGIEPVFCVAYKRRYRDTDVMNFQYVLDPTAKRLVDAGVDPDTIEDAYSIDVQRRVEFQAWVQKYVDHGISSTINLPEWGSDANNSRKVKAFGEMLMEHLPKLRGITCYPDGARGGQPLTPVKYATALTHVGQIFVEGADVCDIYKAGSCGT
jgi:ribonucleoside-diphosphate reductase alpha chain